MRAVDCKGLNTPLGGVRVTNVETGRTVVTTAREPDAELWAALRKAYEGLGAPW
jgi:hypothetical protein